MKIRFRRVVCLLLAAAMTGAAMPGAAALQDVSSWAQPDVAAAAGAGLMPETFGALPAKSSISRAEFCAIALRLYEAERDTTVKRTKKTYFNDCTDPDVNTAYEMELVSGRAGSTFDPDEPVTRQDLCVILDSVRTACEVDKPEEITSASNFPDADDLRAYARDAVETMLAAGVIKGVEATVSDDPESTGVKTTVLAPQGTATREQALIMANRFLDEFEAEPLPEEEQDEDEETSDDEDPVDLDELFDTKPSLNLKMDKPLPVSGSKEEKMAAVFGEDGEYYTDQYEAESHMVDITVPVWTLTSDGDKKSATRTITVNEAIAEALEAVFEEIYEGDEQFPIKNVGGYAWRSNAKSEHRQGTAIDINWEENMECTIDEDGNVVAITSGTHWTPDDDPYSIPAGGDVVRAFADHGFAWGGDAWTSKRDYMHFSYFGT